MFRVYVFQVLLIHPSYVLDSLQNMPKEFLPPGGQKRCHSAWLQVTASRMILLSELSSQMELVVVAYTYNLSTREAEDQEFKALGHTGFCNGDGE